ncbi:uncharacterized protein V1510DRAFT_380673 [Dipodascopsis tothii]|uniref:uncharacterized protein n=1 Tax=Dipodascopsis tothii TaxID=44089 RepID=UPI0034CFEBD8
MLRVAVRALRAPRPSCLRTYSNKRTPADTPYTRTVYEMPAPAVGGGADGGSGGGPRAQFQKPPSARRPDAKKSGTFYRMAPGIIGLGMLLWGGWVIKRGFYDEGSSDEDPLNPERFSTYRITHREKVADDMYLVELAPPYETYQRMQKARAKRKADSNAADDDGRQSVAEEYWDGSRLWSIEVKQPDLQIVRRYTPLPLFYMLALDPGRGEDDKTARKKALLRVLGSNDDEGKFVLMVKRYADGEMSRWLTSLPVGSSVEIRGPFTELALPSELSPTDLIPHPRRPMLDSPSKMRSDSYPLARTNDLLFLAGGTGVAPVLQMLFSRNPPKGQVKVLYSVRDKREIPFPRLLYFLERTGRADFSIFVDAERKTVKASDVPGPDEASAARVLKYDEASAKLVDEVKTAPEFEVARKKLLGERPFRPSLAVVCGPEGYVASMAGRRSLSRENPQGAVGGLLKERGWNETNVFKM